MEIYRDTKTRLAEEITLEANIRILSLKIARNSEPDRIDLEEAITRLTDSREEFLWNLSEAEDSIAVMNAQEKIEATMSEADTLIDSHPRRKELSDFWQTADYWMGRGAFDPDHFCNEVEDDFDFMPY